MSDDSLEGHALPNSIIGGSASAMTTACPRFGFTVEITLAPDATDLQAGDVRRAFSELLDASGMTYANSQRAVWRYLVSRDVGQATNSDREAIAAWAARRSAIASCRIGDLIDLRD